MSVRHNGDTAQRGDTQDSPRRRGLGGLDLPSTAAEAVRSLHDAGYVVASVEQAEGSAMLDRITLDPSRRYAVVLGNEVKGVSQEVVDLSDMCIEIPQFGTKHSLNVSVAGGIIIWEFAKLLMNSIR